MINNKNTKDKKFYLTIVGLIILFALTVNFLILPVSTADMPKLWVNDVRYPFHERYPLEMLNGVPYVYIRLLEYIDGIEIGDEREGGFYISYKKNGTYISFDTKKNYASTPYRGKVEDFYEPTYIWHGVRYVRAQAVADYLDITLDFNEQYGVLRFRDRSARKGLNELIAGYIDVPTTPSPVIPTTTERYVPLQTPPPATPPPVVAETTAEPTTAEDTREIVNYFMFRANGKNYTGQEEPTEIFEDDTEAGNTGTDNNENNDNMDSVEYILDVLKRENIRSIFFMTGSEILKNPTILRKVYALGHEVGIEIEGGKINPSSEDLLSELEEINAIIYTVTKHKTRFYMLDENMYKNSGNNAEADELQLLCIENLKKAGYYQFKQTVEASNFQYIQNILAFYEDKNIVEAVKITEMIELLKREEINIIKFEIGSIAENEYVDLKLVINAIKSKFYITVAKINLPFFLGY